MFVIDRAEIEGMMAIVVKGDALSKDDLKKAFDQIEEVDAVVSSIGGTPADPSADSQVFFMLPARVPGSLPLMRLPYQ